MCAFTQSVNEKESSNKNLGSILSDELLGQTGYASRPLKTDSTAGNNGENRRPGTDASFVVELAFNCYVVGTDWPKDSLSPNPPRFYNGLDATCTLLTYARRSTTQKL